MRTKKELRQTCMIVAEAGVNHNGSFLLAKKMVRAAARAGADFIKFQVFEPAELATPYAPKAAYQKRLQMRCESQRLMLARLALSKAQFLAIKKYCQLKRIGFLATAFDEKSLRFVEDLKPSFHKISSGDIDNLPLLRLVAKYGRQVMLSTGMATLAEVKKALDVLNKAGLPRKKIILLQCHTEYPTQASMANLQVMDTLRKKFRVRVGFSDHTQGTEISLAAIARGATLLEKHFTLNRCLPGPDQSSSINPIELKSLVETSRLISQALGDGQKKPSCVELRNKIVARKSLVASQKILKGEIFTPKNVTAKRPATGMSPMLWDLVMGKRARRNFSADEAIQIK